MILKLLAAGGKLMITVRAEGRINYISGVPLNSIRWSVVHCLRLTIYLDFLQMCYCVLRTLDLGVCQDLTNHTVKCKAIRCGIFICEVLNDFGVKMRRGIIHHIEATSVLSDKEASRNGI